MDSEQNKMYIKADINIAKQCLIERYKLPKANSGANQKDVYWLFGHIIQMLSGNIGKLRIRQDRKRYITMELVLKDGCTSTDQCVVIRKWGNAIQEMTFARP